MATATTAPATTRIVRRERFACCRDAASVPMLCSTPVLPPVAHSVAVRVGATLPAVPVRSRLGARALRYSRGRSPFRRGNNVSSVGSVDDLPTLACRPV